MGKRDPRVDAYIVAAADFAKPILTELRAAVHAACPDAEETMKWSFPHFMYKGILCSMASFKQHAAFGFWKGSLILGDRSKNAEAMGQLGRLTNNSDLPSKRVLAGYLKTAVALNEDGVKVARVRRATAPTAPRMPADLAGALKSNAKARAAFDALTPSHKREYIEWLNEAKRDDTRARRLARTIEWLVAAKGGTGSAKSPARRDRTRP
jgi:uncharacterized protein YdeI (YjbR/CyaY-like superfamily)